MYLNNRILNNGTNRGVAVSRNLLVRVRRREGYGEVSRVLSGLHPQSDCESVQRQSGCPFRPVRFRVDGRGAGSGRCSEGLRHHPQRTRMRRRRARAKIVRGSIRRDDRKSRARLAIRLPIPTEHNYRPQARPHARPLSKSVLVLLRRGEGRHPRTARKRVRPLLLSSVGHRPGNTDQTRGARFFEE